MSEQKVATHVHGHIGVIAFCAPPHNFASVPLLRLIADAIDDFDRDPDVWVLLLRSEGRSFCAGADLGGDPAVSGEEGIAEIGRLYEQAARLFSRKKVMVAAIQGAAIGAGLGLALTADFRLASPSARFSANFARLGFHPGFALTLTLPRLIGAQRAAWLMLSAERMKAEQAVAWGLADRLAPDADLHEHALAFATQLAQNAPLALSAIRATLNDGFAERAAAAMALELHEQAKLKGTRDFAEGVASVFERRDARFIGS